MFNQKGNVPVIAVIFLILILVGGVYLISTRKNSTSNNLTPTATQSDETTNWKTYTNTKHGYTVEYLSDWKIWPSDNQQKASLDVPHFRKVYRGIADHDIQIYIHNNNSLNLNDWILSEIITPTEQRYEKLKYDKSQIKREKTTIGNNQVEVVLGLDLPGAYDFLHIYFIENGKVVDFRLEPFASEQYLTDLDKKAKDTLYHMVSTFKFTKLTI